MSITTVFLFAVLVALYEETEKPNNALEYPFALVCLHLHHSFLKHHLGVAGVETADAEALRLGLSELQQKCELLMEENKELRKRVR
ncbi:unnamed protein product [Coregonus sp. 'balchen']|nr:unnamed protein product [Coregonus sp. 'balchen']